MKTIRIISAAIVAVAGLAACDNSIEELYSPSEPEMIEFKVTADSESSATKVELGDDNQVLWQDDDKIGILSNSYYDYLEIAGGVGTTTATFTGTVHETDEDRIAVYPFVDSDDTRYDGTYDPYVTLAWGINNVGSKLQVAVEDGFWPSTALMAGRVAANNSIAFKNLLSFVKLTTDFTCKRIIFEGNNGERLAAGVVKFHFDDNGVPADIKAYFSPSSTVTLSGMEDEDITPGTYLIGVIPQTLEEGFTLTFELPDDEGECRKTTSKSVTLKRSSILNLGTITEENMDVFPSGAYFKGAGTDAAPYEISSKGKLFILAELLDDDATYPDYAGKSYIQNIDINCNGETLRIGSRQKPFTGTFDGGGFKISDFVAGSMDGAAGLFGAVQNATLKNIVFSPTSFDIEWPSDLYAYCGGLAALATSGENEYVTIDNCHLKSDGKLTISLPDDVYLDYGSLIGKSSGNLSITYCSNDADLRTNAATGSHYTNYNLVTVGGLLGRADSPDSRFLKIDRCWNSGDIEANHVSGVSAGGIVGEIVEPSSFSKDEVTLRLTNSANYGNISAISVSQSANAGGLVADNWADGYDEDPYVINCLNTGNVLATGRPGCVGGLFGKCYDSDTKVYCCVNTGEISGIYQGMPAAKISDYAEHRHIGALCGYDGGCYYYCFWNNNHNELPIVYNYENYAYVVDSSYSSNISSKTMNGLLPNIPAGIVSSYCSWTSSTTDFGLELVITRQ